MIPVLILTLTFAVGDTLKLDLSKAVDMALQGNLDHRVQALSNTSSKLGFADRVTSYLPEPTLQATYSEYETQYGGPIPWKGYLVDLSVTQTIFSFQKLTSLWGGKMDLDRGNALLQEARNSLSYEVENLYLSVLKESNTLEIQTSALKRAEENFRLIGAKGRLGQASKLDVLNAQVTLNQSKLALANAKKNARITKRLFLNVLGIHSYREVVLEPPASQTALSDLPPLQTLLSRASEQRPSLVALQKRVTSANTDFLGQLFAFLPAVSYEWSWQYVGEQFPSPDKFGDEALRGSGISAGLSFNPLSYPLAVQKTKTTLDMARAEHEKEKLIVAKQVEEAYFTYATAEENLDLARLTLDAAKEGGELARAQYRLGLLKPLELFDAETRLLNAEADYLSAVYDVHLYRSALRFAVGGGF